MPITAQASQFISPIDIASWLACAFFLVALFNAAAKAWFTLRGKPSPTETRAATEALTARLAIMEKCLTTCRIEQDRRLSHLENTQKEHSKELLLQINALYNRINPSAESIAEIKGELTGIKSQLSMLLHHLSKPRHN